MYTLMLLIAVPFLAPLYWMVATAVKRYNDVFKSPPDWWPSPAHWSNFLEPFLTKPFLQQLGNSLYIATVVTLGVLTVSAIAGYAFARIRFPGRSVIFILLLAGLLIPPEVTILPLFQILDGFGWIDSHLAVILPDMFGSLMVLGIFLLRQFFITLPNELEQAGRIDGLGHFGLFRWIALPLAKAPLAALAILTFLSSWNELLMPLVFLRKEQLWTVPQALVGFTDANTGAPIWNIQMAATAISIIPVLAVFVFAQKSFIQGIAGTGIK